VDAFDGIGLRTSEVGGTAAPGATATAAIVGSSPRGTKLGRASELGGRADPVHSGARWAKRRPVA